MANEVRQIETNLTFPEVQDILGSVDIGYAEAVVVSNEMERTSGNIFAWKNTGTANGGTVYAGSTGFWEMQHDNSYVDVKWFGAKGDWNGFGTGTVDNIAIQAALNYAATHTLNVYLSKGNYRIDSSTVSAGNLLHLDLESPPSVGGQMVIYGAGPHISSLIYDDYPNVHAASYNILKISSRTNVKVIIEKFGILGFADEYQGSPIRSGTGLYLYKTYPLTVQNMYLIALNEGIRIDAVNNALFENCLIKNVKRGFIGETVDPLLPNNTNPNVLNFNTCQFLANEVLAVNILNAHVINFQSCDISYCGIENTPSLTNVAAIDCIFVGGNGANGLNVKDSYFESNYGLCDIRVQLKTGGAYNPFYGTHTFQGNTFNRLLNEDPSNHNPLYTKHNILFAGDGQEPKRFFGQNKCKLVFVGNGFFVNAPGENNNYEPEPSRKPIEIEQFSNDLGVNYWEFDVLEETNTYNGDPTHPVFPALGRDAPVFGLLTTDQFYGVDSRVMPQVSEFTRIKAFGSFMGNIEGEGGAPVYDTWGYCYNILNIVPREDAGSGGRAYDISFANELKRLPVITATYAVQSSDIILPFDVCTLYVTNKSTTGFTLVAIPISGDSEFRNFLFDFHVF